MTSTSPRTVLITGAARGIGQATALRFAASGCRLALCDLQAEWLEETATLAREAGGRVECYGVDVSDLSAVQQTVDQIVQDFGRIDVLVNNAGITRDGLLARMSEDDWDAVLSVNLKGAFNCSKTVGRVMMKQRGGAMVNVASIIGLIGNPGQVNYAASKGGLIALTKSVARELAGRNVRANAVAPGFIKTKMTDGLAEEVQAAMLANIPMKRFGEPEDVANVIHFLAGDEAAYVTGQVLTICGGMVT